MVYPLITKADGTKFGKTETGSVWLSPQRTSPYRFYQFWLNTDDQDVITYLKYFTWRTQAEIEELAAAVAEQPEQREAQRVLAREMTALVHVPPPWRRPNRPPRRSSAARSAACPAPRSPISSPRCPPASCASRSPKAA